MTLLIGGQPPEGEEQAAVADQLEDAEIVSATIEEAPAQAEPEVVIEPVNVAAEPAAAATPEIITASLEVEPEARASVTLTPAAQPAATIEQTPVADERGVGEIWTVTGSTVNLRAGATTQAAVLGRTKRGESAEVVELLDNGWAKVYILESGLEAYMSAKFLARNNG